MNDAFETFSEASTELAQEMDQWAMLAVNIPLGIERMANRRLDMLQDRINELARAAEVWGLRWQDGMLTDGWTR